MSFLTSEESAVTSSPVLGRRTGRHWRPTETCYLSIAACTQRITNASGRFSSTVFLTSSHCRRFATALEDEGIYDLLQTTPAEPRKNILNSSRTLNKLRTRNDSLLKNNVISAQVRPRMIYTLSNRSISKSAFRIWKPVRAPCPLSNLSERLNPE